MRQHIKVRLRAKRSAAMIMILVVRRKYTRDTHKMATNLATNWSNFAPTKISFVASENREIQSPLPR